MPGILAKPKNTPNTNQLTVVPFEESESDKAVVAVQKMWVAERQAGRWSPPVLTPPEAGRPYSPPTTPVAFIGPYVEPQVRYNPYFLWQLHSYKQFCNNYRYAFSLHRRTSC